MDHTTDFIKVFIWALSGPMVDTFLQILQRVGCPFFCGFLSFVSLCGLLLKFDSVLCEVVSLFWILVLIFKFAVM